MNPSKLSEVEKIAHITSAPGWFAKVGSNLKPILFWVVRTDAEVVAVVKANNGVEYAEDLLNWEGYEYHAVGTSDLLSLSR